jgi:hypothetical protein
MIYTGYTALQGNKILMGAMCLAYGLGVGEFEQYARTLYSFLSTLPHMPLSTFTHYV